MKDKKTKPTPTFTAMVEKLREMNLQYSCDTSYDRVQNCKEYGCNSICRCRKIVDFQVNSLSVDSVVSAVMDKNQWAIDPGSIPGYMLERLVRRLKPEDLDYSISRSYYGEEVDWIKATTLPRFSPDDDDAMRELLNQEYGWIKPELEKAEFYPAVNVPIIDVVVPNQDHYQKLDRKTVEEYKNNPPKFFTCLCRLEGDKFVLVDGYHRYMAAKENGAKRIDVVQFKKEQQ